MGNKSMLSKSFNSSSSNKSFNSSSPQKSFNSSSSNNQNFSLIELDKSVLPSSDLTKWTQTILKCYKNQLKMNQIVSKNICHLKSREEALFHSSIWVAQPGLDTECLVAECAIDQTLKSCSE